MSRFIPRRYHLDDTIGQGAYGVCYKVKDQDENDAEKVIKQMKYKELALDLKEVQSEAKSLYKLDHPFVLKCFHDFVISDFYFVVTEYCEKGNLSSYLSQLKRQKQILTNDEILNWFAQLLSGMKYIHSRKIIHRDIKPENILLKNSKQDGKEILKIGDLGLSKNVLHTISLSNTKDKGTFSYMSPEILRGEPYNNKTDIWSLGCVLFEMCNGDTLFTGRTENEIKQKVLNGELLELTNQTAEIKLIFKKWRGFIE